VNTFKAMAIDIYERKPVFDNVTAGLSGPAIRPIALRIVYELCEALKADKLNIPVVGMGGIATAEDAIQFLLAGAAAVEVGTATFVNPPAMNEIVEGIAGYMRRCGFSRLCDIRMA
jgi:dihydroorotate dehydrogenase (NAD+) catalytic subunit